MSEIKKITYVSSIDTYKNISSLNAANEATLYALVEYTDGSYEAYNNYEDTLPALAKIKEGKSKAEIEILNFKNFLKTKDPDLGTKIESVKKKYITYQFRGNDKTKKPVKKEERSLSNNLKEIFIKTREKYRLKKKAVIAGALVLITPIGINNIGATKSIEAARQMSEPTSQHERGTSTSSEELEKMFEVPNEPEVRSSTLEVNPPTLEDNPSISSLQGLTKQLVQRNFIAALEPTAKVNVETRTESLSLNDATFEKYYGKGNHYYDQGIKKNYNPNQCTSYALGRLKEVRDLNGLNNDYITSFEKYGHGGYWLDNHKEAYKNGETELAWSDDLNQILPGCIISWQQEISYKPNDVKAGHVAYVESVEYNEDGTVAKINYTEGNWNITQDNPQGFRLRSATPDEIMIRNNSWGPYYRQLRYNGFIYTLYNPVEVREDGKAISISPSSKSTNQVGSQDNFNSSSGPQISYDLENVFSSTSNGRKTM